VGGRWLSLRRRSLRARLTLLAVGLLAAGMVVAGIGTRLALQSFLIGRVDQQFHPAEQPALHYLTGPAADQGAVAALFQALPRHAIAAVVYPGGRLGRYRATGSIGEQSEVLGQIRGARPGLFSGEGYRFQAVPAASVPRGGAPGDDEQQTQQLPAGTLLVIGLPLADADSTLSRLVVLELVIGVVVLGVVALLAYVTVRRELQPLRRIETTAAKIAGGDLGQRVQDDDVRTEVGQLGASLNAMLAQIEAAFRERQEAADRLRRFVGDASHELRTPLTSVRGYAELFRRGAADKPEDLALVMSRIEAEAERMGLLVDDLLLLAKLDQRRPIERQRLDMVELVGDQVTDHRMLHGEWPLEFESDPTCPVVGDRPRLSQAVANLLANVRRHTPAGTHVRVSVHERDGECVVEVSDDGPGIPEGHLDQVFERFHRVDPSRARSRGGSGLGLAIVDAIAEAHGGRAEVESTPGHGATFRIVVPAAGDA